MDDNNEGSESHSERRKKEIVLSFSLLTILSLLSRLVIEVWILVVVFLYSFPWLWARVSESIPPTKTLESSRVRALCIGGVLGGIFFVYCIISPDAWAQFPPPFFEIQLFVGFIANGLVLAPMQEIYFRTWLQPRLEELIGMTKSLVLTSLLFMMWHFMPPFFQESTAQMYINVQSILGAIATFFLGLMCGWAFIKSRRLLAPWLTHTIAGMTLIFLGKVVIFTYTE